MEIVVLVGLSASAMSSPLVLGVASTKLQVRVSPSSPTTVLCNDPINEYFTMWSTTEMETNPLCMFFYILRYYNLPTRTFSSISGVSVKANGLGEIWPIEDIGAKSPVFENMVNYFVKRGYVAGVNLTGFPYDFRKGDSENDDQIEQLKLLVEHTYKKNKKKVSIISYSLGGCLCLKLFSSVDDKWKEKYVEKFISVSTIFGGSVWAHGAVISDSYETYGRYLPPRSEIPLFLLNLYLKMLTTVMRTFSSVYWMFPNQNVFPSDHVIVKTPFRNYTASDSISLFLDLSDLKGASIYSNQQMYISPPGVEVYCIYSTGIPTLERIEFDTNQSYPQYPSNMVHGEGDGTVNRVSLEVCKRWIHNKGAVHVKRFHNISHWNIINDERLINYVGSIV